MVPGSAGEMARPILPGAGVDHVRIARVEVDLVDPGPVVLPFEHQVPGPAAVGALVQPAVTASGPHRPLGRHPDHAAASRVDGDPADVARGLEPHVLPGPPAIERLVDAIPEANAPLAVVFAGAHPDHQRVLRVDGQGAHRIRGLVIEDRGPGDAGVLGLPDPARGHPPVPGALVGRIDHDVRDPARGQRRSDAAEPETRDRGG
jgi:hypothetical protein